MSSFGYTRGPYDVGTPADSDLTSPAYMVADWGEIGLQTSGSNTTIQGTLAPGVNETIAEAEWSTLTVLAAAGAFTVDPGMQYLRAIRASTSTVRLRGRVF